MHYPQAAAVLPSPVQPIRFRPASRAKAVPARKTRAAAPADFAEFMELGLTTLVFAAVCLFGAGLLRYGLPYCQVRRIGAILLDGSAAALFAVSASAVAFGIVRLA